MLSIKVPDMEFYNEENNEFVTIKGQEIKLEHSLVSISKWEAKWKKPFLDQNTKKTQEMIDHYVKCMTLTQNVDDNVYKCLSKENWKEISDYIEDAMSATWFRDTSGRPNREIVTSELIYYWMIAFNIPFECQKWHLNRLMTLIKICSIKNDTSSKKMGRKATLNQNRELNKARRASAHSKG